MSELRLTKRIPTRTKTISFLWLRKDFLVMGDDFRKARARMRNKLTSCWWCKTDFKDGDVIALGAIKGTGNKVLCQNCASVAIKGEGDG